MSFFSDLLGKDSTPYRNKAETLKELINNRYFNPPITGIYAEGTQTAQALALYLGLVDEGKEALVAENLHNKVVENNYFF